MLGSIRMTNEVCVPSEHPAHGQCSNLLWTYTINTGLVTSGISICLLVQVSLVGSHYWLCV